MKLGYREAIIENDLPDIRLYSAYDAGFVMHFKLQIPAKDRRWNAVEKYWQFTADHLDDVREMLERFGYEVDDRTMGGGGGAKSYDPVLENIRVNYLGNVRQRQGGDNTASGMDESGYWLYVFSEESLRAWFNLRPGNPAEAKTFYAALGVDTTAKQAEIKAAYRAGVKLWHPDVYDGEGANDAFRALTDAYSVLSDSKARAKYDYGLSVAGANGNGSVKNDIVFVTPDRWRCGYLRVTGIWKFGKLHVSQIHQWQDIERDGTRLVARWETDHVEYSWV